MPQTRFADREEFAPYENPAAGWQQQEDERSKDVAGFRKWRLSAIVESLRVRYSQNENVIRAVKAGRTRYPLTEPLRGNFQQGPHGTTFLVDALLPIVGWGKTRREACQNWHEHVHVVVQRLRAIPDVNWSADERKQWGLLTKYIDFSTYESHRPIKTVQQGMVTQAWPDPWEIKWLDGRVEQFSLDIMPDEFAAFERGDCLEASVDRNPVTKELIYVHQVRPIDPEEEMSPEDATLFWKSLKGTEDLPESQDDWTQP